MLELIFEHSLEDDVMLAPVSEAKKDIQAITSFFRETTEYELLLQRAQALGLTLYSPKSVKDIKFVAHTSGLITDYLKKRLHGAEHALLSNNYSH